MKAVMKHVLNSTVFFALLLLAAGLFLFPEISRTGIATGLKICANSILPALFPFFVITDLFMALGYGQKLAAGAANLATKIFHIPQAATALTLGIIGGYPVGARTVVQLYEAGQLSKKDAQRLLLYCNNAGPAFIIGIAGSAILKSVTAGLILYLIHILSACILGIYFRPTIHADSQEQRIATKNQQSFAEILTVSVKNSGQTTINICVFIIFFSVLYAYLKTLLPSQVKDHLFATFLLASLELAGGLHALSVIKEPSILFCITSFMLGWGGFCVFFQTQTLLDNSSLSSKGYLCSKLFHGLISLILAACVAPVLYYPKQSINLPFKATSLLPVIIAALVGFIFLKKSTGKQKNNGV